MVIAKSSRRHLLRGLAAVFLFGCAAAGMLWRFPPERYGFYPICPIHEYLHLECPGCGATRALAALLHGHLMEALRLNALVIGVILPLAFLYVGIAVSRSRRDGEFRWPSVPRPAVFAMLGLAAAFMLERNL
jgi:hypothetical protein